MFSSANIQSRYEVRQHKGIHKIKAIIVYRKETVIAFFVKKLKNYTMRSIIKKKDAMRSEEANTL